MFAKNFFIIFHGAIASRKTFELLHKTTELADR